MRINQDKPISDATLPANDRVGRKSLALIAFLISVFSGIFFLNPAIALLGSLVARLALDVNPVPNTGKLGKLSLQTAIVLLGFTLGLDRLISVSADYGVIVAVYVLGTLVLGYGLLRLIRTDEVEALLLTIKHCADIAIVLLCDMLPGALIQQMWLVW